MSLLNSLIEDCMDSMSEEDAERIFKKIAGKVKPEVHLKILTDAFKALPAKEKEKVREVLLGKEYLELLKEWKEIEEEYEKQKESGLIGPL